MFERWRTTLEAGGVGAVLGVAALFLAVVLAVEAVTGARWDLSLLLLVPVALTAWRLGRASALALSFIAAAAWTGLHLLAAGGPWLSEVWDGLTRLFAFVLVAILTSTLRAALRRADRAARTDGLTALANKEAFTEAANAELKRSNRYRNPVTVAYFDIDGFRGINDQHGHETGDEVLRLVARSLRASTRDSDVVARLGGDEFAILFPETDEEGSLTALSALKKRVSTGLVSLGWPLTLSVGAVTFLSPPATCERMLEATEALMADAKREGKDSLRHRTLLHV